jgi:(p)ppGpp synthase/HD superfamily hydrolase
MNTQEKIQWCIDQHNKTNHFYDTYLPYEFHLRMVAHVANQHIKLIERSAEGDIQDAVDTIILSAYGHDLIEDTRVSYNDVKSVLGEAAADIIYACTNEKGKNRKERANEAYYEGIRNTPGAVYVKLCDRIANVQYSKMTGSGMFEMYKKENPSFGESLGIRKGMGLLSGHIYFPLYAYLLDIIESK